MKSGKQASERLSDMPEVTKPVSSDTFCTLYTTNSKPFPVISELVEMKNVRLYICI